MASAKEVYPHVTESGKMRLGLRCSLKQWRERPGSHTPLCPEITNGRSGLREEGAHVWNVGLSRAEETLPCFLHSLSHCLALGFRG